jgi:hypothetical protein
VSSVTMGSCECCGDREANTAAAAEIYRRPDLGIVRLSLECWREHCVGVFARVDARRTPSEPSGVLAPPDVTTSMCPCGAELMGDRAVAAGRCGDCQARPQ